MATEIAKRPHWTERDRIDRVDPDRVDQFLKALNEFSLQSDFPIAKGGVEVVEHPGGDEVPFIRVTFIQLPK